MRWGSERLLEDEPDKQKQGTVAKRLGTDGYPDGSLGDRIRERVRFDWV